MLPHEVPGVAREIKKFKKCFLKGKFYFLVGPAVWRAIANMFIKNINETV